MQLLLLYTLNQLEVISCVSGLEKIAWIGLHDLFEEVRHVTAVVAWTEHYCTCVNRRF